MQKLLLCYTFILLFPLIVFAQKATGVSGSVADADSGVGMGYVTIIAKDRNGKSVGAVISQKEGGLHCR